MTKQVFHEPVRIEGVDGDKLRIEHIEDPNAFGNMVAIIDMASFRARMWRANREQLQRLRDECNKILFAQGVSSSGLGDVVPPLHEIFYALGETPTLASERVYQLVLSCVAPLVNALWARITELEPEAKAWRNGQEVLRDLRERVIPCGHKVEDLIGGEGAVTKCGACLADRQARKGL